MELFERFAAPSARAGVEEAPAEPGNPGALDSYAGSASDGPVAALAGFIAYECQASEVARTKADGLRNHYGMDDLAVSFWEHHARVDARHGEWAIEALGDLSQSLDPVANEHRSCPLSGAAPMLGGPSSTSAS